MPSSRRARVISFVMGAGLVATGCGQDTPDRLSFALPSASIDISSDHPGWRTAPATAVPAMVCAGPHAMGEDCCAPPAGVSGSQVDCEERPVACDPATNLCALTFDIASHAVVDLVARVPEVAATAGRVWSRVELSALSTRVKEPMALSIRTADLFVGPKDATSPSSPGVVHLGPVALTEQSTPLFPGPEALASFHLLAREYRMPFAFWVAAHLVVPRGDAPAGTVTIQVDGRLQVWF